MGIAEVASLSERRHRSERSSRKPGAAGESADGPDRAEVRAVVVHGDPGVREQLADQLAHGGIAVVAAVATAQACTNVTADVVVVAHRAPGTSAIDLCEQLGSLGGSPVVLVAAMPRAVLLRRALQAGARGFVAAESPPDVLADAVEAVAAGRSFIDPAVGDLVIDLVRRRPSAEYPYGLTQAQLAVVSLLPQGLPNRLIAAELGISENTVKTHLRHALKKLGVRDRAQAAALVVREGLA